MGRRLDALTPETERAARRFLALADQASLDVLIYCTYRSPEEQAYLFRSGRALEVIERKAEELERTYKRRDLAAVLREATPNPGHHIKTYAGPGQSYHQYGRAFDFVPMGQGKPIWGTMLREDRLAWDACGELVREAGLDWAAKWRTWQEYPHAQLPGPRWQELIVSGSGEIV